MFYLKKVALTQRSIQTPILHVGFAPKSVRGCYIIFGRINCTYVPRNHHMPYRACGDLFILKLQYLRYDIAAAEKGENLDSVLYEDIPTELMDPPHAILNEMLISKEWKIIPASSSVRADPTIVSLGLPNWLGLSTNEKKSRGMRRKCQEALIQKEVQEKLVAKEQVDSAKLSVEQTGVDQKVQKERQQKEKCQQMEKEKQERGRPENKSEQLAWKRRDQMEKDRQRKANRIQAKEKRRQNRVQQKILLKRRREQVDEHGHGRVLQWMKIETQKQELQEEEKPQREPKVQKLREDIIPDDVLVRLHHE